MITVDLNLMKILVFDTTNTENIKSAEFIISFPNNVMFSYPGIINIETNTIFVELPILKENINKELEANCYIELKDNEDKKYKFANDTIKFFFGNKSEIKFQSINAIYRNEAEIILDNKNLKISKITPNISKKLKTII